MRGAGAPRPAPTAAEERTIRAETVATATAPPTDREAVVGVAATSTPFAAETAPVETAAAEGTAAAIISAASAGANLAWPRITHASANGNC